MWLILLDLPSAVGGEHCFPLQLLLVGFSLPELLKEDFKAFLLIESQKPRVDPCDVQMLKPIPAPPHIWL